MADLARCNYDSCTKSETCKRFIKNCVPEYEIKNVCNEKNGYDLLIQDEMKVAKIKEEDKKKEIIPEVKKEVKKDTDTSK